MAIKVVKAAAEHKAVIIRFSQISAAGLKGGVHHFVDGSLAFHAQGDKHFGGFCGIRDVLGRKFPKLFVGNQHRINGVRDNQAGRGIVGILFVKGVAQFPKKGF